MAVAPSLAQELDELQSEWQARIDQLGLPGGRVVRDGALGSAYWDRPELRVLFVLREPNAEDEDDMVDRVRNHRSPTWRGMVALCLVTKGLPLPDALKWSQDEGLEHLSHAALINAKKTKGGGSSDRLTLGGHLWSCADLLRRQLQLLDPRIVIFAQAGPSMPSILGLAAEPEVTLPKAHGWSHYGRVYIGTHHPSAIRAGRAFIEHAGRIVAQLTARDS